MAGIESPRRDARGLAPGKKETRARQVWERYGLPVLALLDPIIAGTDIAAAFALTFGAAYGFAYMNWI